MRRESVGKRTRAGMEASGCYKPTPRLHYVPWTKCPGGAEPPLQDSQVHVTRRGGVQTSVLREETWRGREKCPLVICGKLEAKGEVGVATVKGPQLPVIMWKGEA